MRQTKFVPILLLLLISVTPASSLSATEIDLQPHHSTSKEATGFGAGMLIGAVFGGPPGAAIGAISGGLLGHHETKHTENITAVESELKDKQLQIHQLQTEVSMTQGELEKTLSLLQSTEYQAQLDLLRRGLNLAVYFRSEETQLSAANTKNLNKIAKLLNDFPEVQVQMEGYADFYGDVEYNQHLSELRVDSVKSLFELAGISVQRIHCQSYGEQKALENDDDNDNHAFDRRVSLQLYLEEPTKALTQY